MRGGEAVQRAVVARWAANAWLAANCPLGFEQLPEGTGYPHAAFFVSSVPEHNAGGVSGETITLKFQIYSDVAGSSQPVSTIADKIRVEMRAGALAVGNGYTGFSAPALDLDVVTRDEALNWQATLQFEFKIKES
jgi:hypothetical protein